MSRSTARRTLAVVAVIATSFAALTGVSLSLPPASASATGSTAITVTRIAGADRYATAVAIARAPIPAPIPAPTATPTPTSTPGVDPVVFIATGADFPDALAAAPIAAKFGGSLLLTPPASLPSGVAAELVSLHPTTVVIMGGTSVVTPTVENAITTAVPAAHIVRIAGADRYATAEDAVNWAISNADPAFGSTAYLATGGGFADALSAAAAAGASNAPVFLVPPGATSLDATTTGILTALGTTSIILVGGPSAVSSTLQTTLTGQFSTVTRLSGADRYATALAIAKSMTPTGNAYLATGANFPDALAGAVAAGRAGSPLLTVPSTCVPAATLAYLHGTTSAMYELGSTGVLGTNIDALVPCASATYRASVSRIMAVNSNANPGVASRLNDISCVNANWCVAAGSVPGRPAVATLASGRWTSTITPLPSGAVISAASQTTTLSTVQCGNLGSCMANGTYLTKGGTSGLVESLSGTSWTASSSAVPSNVPADSAANTHCSGADFCLDVTQAPLSGEVNSPVVVKATLSGNGTSSSAILPLPRNARGRTAYPSASVAVCPRAGVCMVIGQYMISATDAGGFLDTLSNGTWTSHQLPVPSDQIWTTYVPTGIACPTASVCRIVGYENYIYAPPNALPGPAEWAGLVGTVWY